MKPHTISKGKTHILYDADVLGQVDASFFELSHWQQQGLVRGFAQGRGETAFIALPLGEVVLRHYRRGGLPGRFLKDQYLWRGLAATRAWREWQLTAQLFAQGLPVPRPIAARVTRQGLGYRADLVTLRLPGTESLAACLNRAVLTDGLWPAIGRCLRRFHTAGLDHADLNAHNILIDANEQIFLIDLDRGRLRAPGAWQAGNLQRLLRSLNKLQGQHPGFAFTPGDWEELMRGYQGD